MSLIAEQQAERRERILRVTRRQLATRSYDGVTVREIAREALISVPTLYKLFGSKQELLFQAVEDGFRDSLLNAGSQAVRGLDCIFAIVERVAEDSRRVPHYARVLTAFYSSAIGVGRLQETINGELARQLGIALHEMRADGELVGWVDIDMLAERLAAQFAITGMEWATHHLSDAGLRASLCYGTCMMLMGVACGEARRSLKRRIIDTQRKATDREETQTAELLHS